VYGSRPGKENRFRGIARSRKYPVRDLERSRSSVFHSQRFTNWWTRSGVIQESAVMIEHLFTV